MADIKKLQETVATLMRPGTGILAADESESTAGKRLKRAGLPNEPEYRQDFRELLFTAPGIEAHISGVIMFDASIRNATDDGIPFPDVLTARGILPGIKVDLGKTALSNFPEEFVTEGLDGLKERAEEYYALGARFAKWRAVVKIGEGLPTDASVRMNAVMLARYAGIVQEAGLVPIVEPEVLLSGDHSLARAEEVTAHALKILFETLAEYRIDLSALILKTSMVLAGSEHAEQSGSEEVAEATIRTLRASVPSEVGGVVFLSGGQSPTGATANLNAIAKASGGSDSWPISSSFSRALEQPVLDAWQGKSENVEAAKQALFYRTKMNALAREGKYDPDRDQHATSKK
jgi:fructose-bisphosphate aldolase class I